MEPKRFLVRDSDIWTMMYYIISEQQRAILTLMASTVSYLSSLLMWLVMLVLRGAAEMGWITVASWDCC